MTQLIVTIVNALLSALESGTPLKGLVPGIISDILSVAGNIGGGLDLARIEELGNLTLNAAKGYVNSWQALYNWANYVGSEYPHGQEPSETLGLAKTLLKIVSLAEPSWASQFTKAGGTQGEPDQENNGVPSLH